jgi:translation initiation factor IF-3
MDAARSIAEKLEMDLIEINSSVNPPIIKIGNYEKILYEMKKNQKKNKQQTTQVKEIMLTTNIAKHDLETKAKKAKEFIEEGNKVRVTLTMKGRELTRREESQKSILEFIVMLDDVAIPEGKLTENGNRTIVVLKKKK